MILMNIFLTRKFLVFFLPYHYLYVLCFDFSTPTHKTTTTVVSGYFAIAAAQFGRYDIFAEELVKLTDLSEQNATFAEFYEFDKSFPPKRYGIQYNSFCCFSHCYLDLLSMTFLIFFSFVLFFFIFLRSFCSSRRQLWSDTGYLGMIYKGLFGMTFLPDGIIFAPKKYNGDTINEDNDDPNDDEENKDSSTFFKLNETMSLTNIKYRKMIVNVHVRGYGDTVESFKLNGERKKVPKLDGYSTGRQLIEITVGPSQS